MRSTLLNSPSFEVLLPELFKLQNDALRHRIKWGQCFSYRGYDLRKDLIGPIYRSVRTLLVSYRLLNILNSILDTDQSEHSLFPTAFATTSTPSLIPISQKHSLFPTAFSTTSTPSLTSHDLIHHVLPITLLLRIPLFIFPFRHHIDLPSPLLPPPLNDPPPFLRHVF